jgi:hypothetical protein
MVSRASYPPLQAIPPRLPLPSDYEKYGDEEINSAMKELTDARLMYIEMEPEWLLRLYNAVFTEEARLKLVVPLNRNTSSRTHSLSEPSTVVSQATSVTDSGPLLLAPLDEPRGRGRWLFAHEAATQLLTDVIETTGKLHSSMSCLKLGLINAVLKHMDAIEKELELLAGSTHTMKRKFVLELGSHVAPHITSRTMLP